MKFEGVPADSTNKLLGISGGASGAGVAITNAGGEVMTLGTASSAYTLTEGTNILDFAAYLQGLGSSATITTGEFTAISTFALTYQ